MLALLILPLFLVTAINGLPSHHEFTNDHTESEDDFNDDFVDDDCCDEKIVGGIEYTKVEGEASPSQMERLHCISSCLYVKEGSGQRFCFGPGKLTVVCEDEFECPIGECRPKAQCIGRFPNLADATATTCELDDGVEGFCCRDIIGHRPDNTTKKMKPLFKAILKKPDDVTSEQVTESLEQDKVIPPAWEVMMDHESKSHMQLTKARSNEEVVLDNGIKMFRLNKDVGLLKDDDEAEEDVDGGNPYTGFSSENSDEISEMCIWETTLKPDCESEDKTKYRTVDGSCNNIEHPLFGMARTPFDRLLNATYHLKGNQPRLANGGSELPSGRVISQSVFKAGDSRDEEISAHFMQFGQFLDHDLTHTPTVLVDMGPPMGKMPPQCCVEGTTDETKDLNWGFPELPYNGLQDYCHAIEIPEDDEFWSPKGRRCMDMSRSEIAPTIYPLLCESGRWDPRNSLSHWADGSQIYGSTEEEAADVIDEDDPALLKVTDDLDHTLLPKCKYATTATTVDGGNPYQGGGDGETTSGSSAAPHSTHTPESCCGESAGCMFIAGDFRVNEQPGLTVQHTVWMKEHNRVAGKLREINPDWEDETVFQKARRIVIAEWQNIIYTEWLPILLGVQLMEDFGLQPLTSGYSEDYDANFNPSLVLEFASAAFRFGHSMVTPTIPGMMANATNNTLLDFKDAFSQAKMLIEEDFIEDTVRGFTNEKAPACDGTFVDDITNFLFHESNDASDGGMDLSALNIQRARDHGIPGYNHYREYCNDNNTVSDYGRVEDFDELTEGGWLDYDAVERLKGAYDHVDDIDLFVGGMLEKPNGDGLVGPVFQCIIGEVFTRLKRGDRFYYENGGDDHEDTQFTLEQLDSLRTVSMARILCDNTDIERAQPLMMRVPGPGNEKIDCYDYSIPSLDLDLFIEDA